MSPKEFTNESGTNGPAKGAVRNSSSTVVLAFKILGCILTRNLSLFKCIRFACSWDDTVIASFNARVDDTIAALEAAESELKFGSALRIRLRLFMVERISLNPRTTG